MFEIDLKKYRIVDLSYEVVPGGGGDRPFVIQRGLLADNAYKYDVTKTHSHVGTHVEAPAHFYDGGKDVTQLPLTAYFGRALLLEVHDAKATKAIMGAYCQKTLGGLIRPGDIIICRNNDEASKKAGKDALPHLTPESAEWMRDKKIKMLGVDNYVRLAKDIPEGRQLHDILMKHDITFVEWLDNLAALKRREFFFMALPFKVRVMDSSWARAIAIEEI
jgi:kynurenine formamidase